ARAKLSHQTDLGEWTNRNSPITVMVGVEWMTSHAQNQNGQQEKPKSHLSRRRGINDVSRTEACQKNKWVKKRPPDLLKRGSSERQMFDLATIG
ncbi:hypothetical protein C8029_06995, partial [Roseobacter sp. TSBP12]